MPDVPSWFIIVPFLTGIIPLSLLIVFLVKQNKDIMIPQFMFALPLLMFIIPMAFLDMYLFDIGISIPFLILPIITGIAPCLVLVMNIAHTRQYAPEGEPFKRARLLRQKGKFADVIMVWEGTNTVRFGCFEKDPSTGQIVYETKKYGLKIDPSKYPDIPQAKTNDGVPIVCLSPLQITTANGESAMVVQEMMEYVRSNYKQFNHLSDLALGTLLTTMGTDLEEDAHLYINTSDPKLTEDEIIRIVKEIQDHTNKEFEIYPANRFLFFPKFFAVVNCAYNSSFLKDHELTVRSMTLETIEKKSIAEKLLPYAVFIGTVLITGAIAVMIIAKFT
jgi:hypothetical protein